MTTPKQVTMEPNSPEWLEWRANFRTASEAAIVLGISPFTSRKQFKLIKAGLVKQYYSKAMEQGHIQEEGIRQWCNEKFGRDFKEEMWERGEYAASLDGKDGNTLVEIKNSAFTYNKLAGGGMDDAYMSQIQQQLYCSGAEVGYLVARNPKTDDIIMSDPIEPDPLAMIKIGAAWEEFDAMPLPEGDLVLDDNLELVVLFERYNTLKMEEDSIKAAIATVREQLIAFAPERSVKCRGNKIVFKAGAMRTDYKSACADANLVLDGYKKEGAPSYMIKVEPSPFEADEDV